MKLKSALIVILSIFALSSCGPNKEEKAQNMAANSLKGVLFHFDSYEPLETKVDSLYTSFATDKEAINLTIDMLKLFQSAEEYAEKVERAEKSMEVWSPNTYSSTFGKGQYRRATEDRDGYQRRLEQTRDRIKKQFSLIKERQEAISEGKFDGWFVYHKFKSLNGPATVYIFGEYIFICDSEFKERMAYPKEEYDAICKIMTAISTSNDVPGMIEKLQEEIF